MLGGGSAVPVAGHAVELGVRGRRMIAPGAVVLLAIVFAIAWREFAIVQPWVAARGWLLRLGDGLPIVMGGAAAAMLAQAALPTLLVRHFHLPATRMFRQLIVTICWLIAMGIVGAIFFDVPVGSLVTTSGLLVAMVGIALKNVISDVFTGLSLP